MLQMMESEGRAHMLLTIARQTWNITKWIWLVFIIPTGVDLFKSAITAKKPQDILPHSFLFGPDYRTLTLSVLGVLLAITLSARILTAVEEYHENERGLKKYLHNVANKNQNLKTVGFAQQSALVSVSILLDSTYIPLHALSDRPRYDMPARQGTL